MKWLAIINLCISCVVSAHSASTAFMQVQTTATGLSAHLDLSIADLQQALNWPVDQDIRWSDILKQQAGVISYLQQHLYLQDSQHNRCILQTDVSAWTAVEKNQSYYLRLPLFSPCDAQQSTLNYRLFSELHDHKLLVNWQQKQQIISPQNPQLNFTQLAP